MQQASQRRVGFSVTAHGAGAIKESNSDLNGRFRVWTANIAQHFRASPTILPPGNIDPEGQTAITADGASALGLAQHRGHRDGNLRHRLPAQETETVVLVQRQSRDGSSLPDGGF